MKGRRLFAIPPPLEGDEETLLVSFCIPDTHGWRSAATALLSQFDYGRAYDEDTGSVLGALEVGKEIFNSMSMCDLDEMTRAIRELTAVVGGRAVDLTQPIPDNLDYTSSAYGLLPMLHEHLQSLGPIPKAGDTIMTSLQKLVEGDIVGNMTLDDLIEQIESFEPTLFDRWKDYLEVLSFMATIFPGTTRVDIVGDFFEKLSLARYRHNDLTIKGYQATALRGIMRGLAPFEDEAEEEEQSLLEKFGSIPWLGKAAIALVEPTPGGETWLAAATLAQAVQGIFDKIKEAWATWFSQWVNQVETPTPTNNVTTAISSLSAAIGGLDLEPFGGNPNQDQGISLQLAGVVAALQSIGTKCSFCGGSGGCGCGETGGLNNPANVLPFNEFGEEDDLPPGLEPTNDDFGTSGYYSRKCKIANILHDMFRQFVSIMSSKSGEIAAAKTLGHAAGLALTVIVVSYALGELATPIPLIDGFIVGVIGGAAILAAYILANNVIFDDLLEALDTRQSDLVCALFASGSMSEAKSDYSSVLQDEGIGTVTANLAGSFLSLNLAAILFADISGLGEALDTALLSYSPDIDCSACDPCPVIYDDGSDWSSWTSIDASTNSGSSTGTITDHLSYTVTVASSPSGASLAQRRFVVPLLEVYAGGWVPTIGSTITIQIDGDGPGAVGHWVWVNYATDPQQFSGSTVLANSTGAISLSLNSDDTISSIWVVAGNSRTSGTSSTNNSGKFTSVEFCN